MPNYLERIFAAGARTASETKPGTVAPPRIPGVMLPSVLHLDDETSPEQAAAAQSSSIATSLRSGASDLLLQEAAQTPGQTSNLGRTAPSNPEVVSSRESLPISTPPVRIAEAQSQPGLSSLAGARGTTSRVAGSAERKSPATLTDRKMSGKASMCDAGYPT
jgi:hypothetical protein